MRSAWLLLLHVRTESEILQHWCTFQPESLRRAGRTTRLKVTMLLTGFPGSPNTIIWRFPFPSLPSISRVAKVRGFPGFILTYSIGQRIERGVAEDKFHNGMFAALWECCWSNQAKESFKGDSLTLPKWTVPFLSKIGFTKSLSPIETPPAYKTIHHKLLHVCIFEHLCRRWAAYVNLWWYRVKVHKLHLLVSFLKGFWFYLYHWKHLFHLYAQIYVKRKHTRGDKDICSLVYRPRKAGFSITLCVSCYTQINSLCACTWTSCKKHASICIPDLSRP